MREKKANVALPKPIFNIANTKNFAYLTFYIKNASRSLVLIKLWTKVMSETLSLSPHTQIII